MMPQGYLRHNQNGNNEIISILLDALKRLQWKLFFNKIRSSSSAGFSGNRNSWKYHHHLCRSTNVIRIKLRDDHHSATNQPITDHVMRTLLLFKWAGGRRQSRALSRCIDRSMPSQMNQNIFTKTNISNVLYSLRNSLHNLAFSYMDAASSGSTNGQIPTDKKSRKKIAWQKNLGKSQELLVLYKRTGSRPDNGAVTNWFPSRLYIIRHHLTTT